MENQPITIPNKKSRKRIHPADVENLFNMFNNGLRERARDELKESGFTGSENEINTLIIIWFNEYINGNGTNLKVPSDLMTKLAEKK